MLAVRLVIRLKLATQSVWLRRRADIYVDRAGGWRYPSFLLRALRRCGDPLLEVPQRDAIMAWGADGFRNFVFRTRVVREGARVSAPIVVAQDPGAIPGEARSRVPVSVDWFSSDERADELVMPYFVHPDLRRFEPDLGVLGSGQRPIRIGFAGTMNEKTYREDFSFPMLSRADVLAGIEDEFPDKVRVVRSRAELDELDTDASPIVFVAVTDDRDTTAKHVLRGRDYLAFLGRCAFVVTPPGYRMPLCHNLIEAMSVGAIPILNYSEWVHPPLHGGVTCIGFSTRDELAAAVARALAMGDDEVERLRAGVTAYYAEHLSVESFSRRLCPLLEHSPTIVVNAERDTVAAWRERQSSAADRAPR